MLVEVGENLVNHHGILDASDDLDRTTTGSGSSQQGCNLAGESPAVSVARVGHVAIPHLGAGNQPSYAWCKRPGRPVVVESGTVVYCAEVDHSGGCNLGV